MTDPIAPSPVVPPSKVCVVAPAGPVSKDPFQRGLAILEDALDYKCSVRPAERHWFHSAGDGRRLASLQQAVDDPECGAVIAARGGWGTTRIIDDLDTSSLVDRPKWLVGSSDLTALLMEVWSRHGLRSIHGPMVERFETTAPEDLRALFNLLSGKPLPASSRLIPLFEGKAEGPMIGGNLTVLAHMCGKVDPRVTDGAVLFLEDVGERPYRLDRALTQLRRSGMLENLGGVVIGELTACDPNPDGLTASDVMRRNLAGLEIPVAGGYPAAHGGRNLPFIHGGLVTLSVEGNEAKLSATTR